MGRAGRQAGKIALHSSRKLCLEHDSLETKQCHFCPFHRSNLAEAVAKKGARGRYFVGGRCDSKSMGREIEDTKGDEESP